MRIIAGEFRGRRLLPPLGMTTRPITDRAKQSLFDILAPRLPDAVTYDLFAGTGSMGIESLSRGASAAYFFEGDRSALTRLRQNIAAIGMTARAKVIVGDLFKLFAAPPASWPRANVVFLDPPYSYLRERPAAVRALAQRLAADYLAADGVVVFRHDAADILPLAPLAAYDQRTYGGMAIELLHLPHGSTDLPSA